MMVHIRKLVKPILFSFLIVLGYALLIRLTINPASAANVLDINQGTGNTYSVSTNAQGQSFKPTHNNISQFGLRYRCANGITATSTVSIYLCHGTPPNATDYPNKYDCNGWADLVQQENNKILTCNGSTEQTLVWDIVDHQTPGSHAMPVVAGDTYYVSVKVTSGSAIGVFYNVGSLYADGFYLGGAEQISPDAKFFTYYDDGFYPQDYEDVTVIDWNSTMGYDYQMISFNEDNFCMATSTETCSVPFRFNDYAVGSVVYAYLGTGGNATGTLLASTSIADNVTDTGYLQIPYVAEYVGEKKPMCAFLYDPDLEEASQMICNWNIDWLSQEEMNELMARSKISEYNIQEACDDMDDTASTTFLYGIECGFRKVVYWATKPSAETQMAFLTSASNLKSQFPMSVYYQVKDNMMRLPTEWATTSTSTLPSVPLMWAGQDTGADLLRADIISSSQMSDTWERFNDYLSYFIYMMTFLYFVSEIFAHADRQNKQE